MTGLKSFPTGRRCSLSAITLLLTLFFSCKQSSLYERYQMVDMKWSKDREYYFTYEIDDHTTPYRISLEIRHNALYPFQNLWLFCMEEQPIGPALRDTLECMFADNYGKWLGHGISIYHVSIPFRSRYLFPHRGQYTLNIRHGMREDYLRGIEEIGLCIEAVK
ncbi:MAG: gliding motility lipoprotein GldH [Tannerella sp.]|jgi:gliding motility-associated lipoprotein GldH|nr:gliding motility lipoprotein GldH [Tannerella sp.]